MNNKCVCGVEAGATQPHDLHDVPTARARTCVRQDAVPRRVHAGGARSTARPQRGKSAGNGQNYALSLLKSSSFTARTGGSRTKRVTED